MNVKHCTLTSHISRKTFDLNVFDSLIVNKEHEDLPYEFFRNFAGMRKIASADFADSRTVSRIFSVPFQRTLDTQSQKSDR